VQSSAGKDEYTKVLCGRIGISGIVLVKNGVAMQHLCM